MIRHTIYNLRSPKWEQVSRFDIELRIERTLEFEGERTTIRVVPWERDWHGHPFRSYLLLLSDGGLYAIFFNRVERIDCD